jgi:hypothetical protein
MRKDQPLIFERRAEAKMGKANSGKGGKGGSKGGAQGTPKGTPEGAVKDQVVRQRTGAIHIPEDVIPIIPEQKK